MDDLSGIDLQMERISNSLEGVTGKTHNAILYVPSGSGGEPIEDPITGVYTFPEVKLIEYKLYLWEEKKPDYLTVPQTDLSITYMCGYLVEPLSIEGYHDNYRECDLLQNGEWVKGRFTFIDDATTGLEESYKIQNAIGQSIKGYWERNNDTV